MSEWEQRCHHCGLLFYGKRPESCCSEKCYAAYLKYLNTPEARP